MDEDYEIDYRDDDAQYYESFEPSHNEIFHSCIWPTIAQISKYMVKFVFWNFVFRLTTQTCNIPRPVQHISSISCGLAMSYFILGWDSFYSFSFTAIEYLLLVSLSFFNRKCNGFVMTIFCLSTLIFGEIIGSEMLAWHKMRGTQMIAVVKIISIAFDIDRERIKRRPSFLEFWGYILCPGNVIMGPWCAFNDYLLIFHRSEASGSFLWIGQSFLNGMLAIVFLLASNCVITSYIPDFSFKWLEAYKGALSYRCSHYFICFLSHCTMQIAGFDGIPSQRKPNTYLGQIITKPWIIELPRSLVDVVVYWNLSMHYWLKTYIFAQLKPYGGFIAIISTYFISSLLHGVNLQLASVLLSLGFATYSEYELRRKIADIFNACVAAHPCKDCSHQYKSQNVFVRITNLMFGMLAVFHLAYLGVMFDGPAEHYDLTHSIVHIQNQWGNLDYLSHWIILLTFVTNFFI